MALRFLDSFDHYATANITTKWNTRQGSSNSISSGTGRNTNSFRVTSSANYLAKTLDAQATWIIGFAIKIGAVPTNHNPIVSLLDASTIQCNLGLNPDGTLQVTRTSGNTPVTNGISVKALQEGIWYYIEMKVTISNSISSNTWQVRVNGEQWINVSAGESSRSSANNSATNFRIGVITFTTGTTDFDDLYVCDGTTGTPANNDFLGDLKVLSFLPSGAGTTTQWTPSAGSNYQCVDESAPNDDTDYVSSSTLNQIDTYAFADITDTPGTIFGLQTNLYARKDDVAARSIARVIRSTSNFVGSTVTLSTTYAYYQEIAAADPNTSAAWTKTNLNAAEFGVKMIA